jgi:hypothetical protein
VLLASDQRKQDVKPIAFQRQESFGLLCRHASIYIPINIYIQVIYVLGQYENGRIFPSLKRRGGAKRRGGPFGEIFRPEGFAGPTASFDGCAYRACAGFARRPLLQRWLRDILFDVAVARILTTRHSPRTIT